MKRKTIMVLLVVTLCLSACGNKNNAIEESSTQTEAPAEVDTEEAETETAPIAEEANTEEPAEAVEAPASGPYDNLEDWVIGKDIWVYEQPDGKRRVSNLPELSIKLPSKDNLLGVDEFSNGNEYNIEIPNTGDFIVVLSSLKWAESEDLCLVEQMHKELTTYGRYTFDWGYFGNIANIAVGCPEVDTSIWITFNIYKIDETDDRKPTSDEAEAEFEKFVNTNVEYIREQVQAWDQNYVPTGELSSVNASANNEPTEEKELIVPEDTVEPSEEDVNSFFRTYKQVDGSCSYTFVQGDTWEDTTVTASDGSNSYEFDMEVLGEGTYGVYSDDTEVFEIYEEEYGIEIYVIDDAYSAFSGIYE